MRFSVSLSSDYEVRLHAALLLYSGQRQKFATLHDVVENPSGGAPILGPAQPLTTAFLRELCESLGRKVRPEILPDSVLVRTPECLVWWVRAQHRTMFFAEHAADNLHAHLNGRRFAQPPLVFKVAGRELSLRALPADARPRPETPLKVAPYWNLGTDGRCCFGSMRVPSDLSIDGMARWEQSFFESEFSHIGGALRLTKHPGGFAGLWKELAHAPGRFPLKYLSEAKETLTQFVERT
jgi:PRTRC genetic system protein B